MQQNTLSVPEDSENKPDVGPLKQLDPDVEVFSVNEAIITSIDDHKKEEVDPTMVTGSSDEEETITNLSVRSLEDSMPTLDTHTVMVGAKVEYYDSDVIDLEAESISTVATTLRVNPNVAYYDPDVLMDVDHVESVKSAARKLSFKNVASLLTTFLCFRLISY
jgi:hypothetical protein